MTGELRRGMILYNSPRSGEGLFSYLLKGIVHVAEHRRDDLWSVDWVFVDFKDGSVYCKNEIHDARFLWSLREEP